ncbi:hypothetical protein C8J56DRAFT_889729 [Mycena floridula]|nr:hypothetical protein C8J56DRAFT_889729 [Mycena floridula]
MCSRFGFLSSSLAAAASSSYPHYSHDSEIVGVLRSLVDAKKKLVYPRRIGFPIAFLFDGLADVVASQRLSVPTPVDKSFRWTPPMSLIVEGSRISGENLDRLGLRV